MDENDPNQAYPECWIPSSDIMLLQKPDVTRWRLVTMFWDAVAIAGPSCRAVIFSSAYGPHMRS